MIRFIFVAIFLLAYQATSAQQVVRGNIVVLVEQIRSAMPDMNSGGFVVPVDSQLLAFQNVVSGLKQGNQNGLAAMLSPYRYEWISFIDTVAAESLIVVRELTPVQRGWGTFIRNPRSLNDCSVEVPHPIWDTNSWELGIRTYLRLRAHWFLMAGTHRYANSDSSSDVAHKTQTVFHTAHKTIASFRSVQTHGFDRSNPNYLGYAEAIISNGTLSPPAELTTLKTNYESRAITANVFSTATYAVTWRLGATTNVQGQWSNANGNKFVHVEHDYPIRTNITKLLQAVEALNAVFGVATAVDQETAIPARFALEQNYPNPFNPTTIIRFQLSTKTSVRLAVYDPLGREIALLLNQTKDPGSYSVIFDAHILRSEALPSGVYYYRLATTSGSQAHPMIYLR